MRNTKWTTKTIPNPRQEREYIERDNKQKNDKKVRLKNRILKIQI